MTPPPTITSDDLIEAAGAPAKVKPGTEPDLTGQDLIDATQQPGILERVAEPVKAAAMSVRDFLAGGGLLGAAQRSRPPLDTGDGGPQPFEAQAAFPADTRPAPTPPPPVVSDQAARSIERGERLPAMGTVLEGAVGAQKAALAGADAKTAALSDEIKAINAENGELTRIRASFDASAPSPTAARSFNTRARALSARLDGIKRQIDELTPESHTALMRAYPALLPYVSGVPLPHLPETGPLGTMLSPVPEWNMRAASRRTMLSGSQPAISSQSEQEYQQAKALTPIAEAEEGQAKPLRERKNLNVLDQALVAADDKLHEAMGPAYDAIELPIRRIFTGATNAGPGNLARAMTHAADEALGGMLFGGERAGGRLRGDEPGMAGRLVESGVGFATEWPLFKAGAALAVPPLKLALEGVAGRIYRSALEASEGHLSPALARILAQQAIGNSAAVERLIVAQRSEFLARATEAGYEGAAAAAVADQGVAMVLDAVGSVRPDRVATILSHALPGAGAVAFTDSMREASRQLAEHGTITDKGAIAVETLTGAALGGTVGAVSGAIQQPVLQQLLNLGGYALLGPIIKHGQAPTVEDALAAGVPAALIYAATKLAAARARGQVEILGPEEGPFGRPAPGQPSGGPAGPNGGPPVGRPPTIEPSALERIRAVNESLEQTATRLAAMEPRARGMLTQVITEWARLKEADPELQAWEDKESLARTKREARQALAEAPPVVKLDDKALGTAIHDEFARLMGEEVAPGTPGYAEMARALSTQGGEEPPPEGPAAEPEQPRPPAPVFPTVPDRMQPAARTPEAKGLRPVATVEESRRLVDDLLHAGLGASIDVMSAAGEVQRWTKGETGQWTREDNPGAMESSSGVAHGAQGRGDVARPARSTQQPVAQDATEPPRSPDVQDRTPREPETAPRATPEPAEETVSPEAQAALDELKAIFEGEAEPKAAEPPKKEPEPAQAPERAESSPAEGPPKAESRPAEAEPPKAPAKAEEPAYTPREYKEGDRVRSEIPGKPGKFRGDGTVEGPSRVGKDGWMVRFDDGTHMAMRGDYLKPTDTNAPERAPRAAPAPAERTKVEYAKGDRVEAFGDKGTVFGRGKRADSYLVRFDAGPTQTVGWQDMRKLSGEAMAPAPPAGPRVEYKEGDRVEALGDKGSILGFSYSPHGDTWLVQLDNGKTQKIHGDYLKRLPAEDKGPKFEKTPIGDQAVVPGASARAMPDKPLKPQVAQKEPGGLFKPPPAPKDQQAELPTEAAPVAAHDDRTTWAAGKGWLGMLEPKPRQDVMEVMRAMDAEGRRLEAKGRSLEAPPGSIAVGSAMLDDFVRGYGLGAYVGALGKGDNPASAMAAAKTEMKFAVAKHNAKRPNDINWKRDSESGQDVLLRWHQQILGASGTNGAGAPAAATPEAVTPEPHASAEPHEFSSTQLELPTEIANDVIRWARAHIAPEDLAEGGIEQHAHVTVKYGLHTNDVADVEALLSGEGPIKVQLGPMSKFGGDESDVLHIAVQSPDLHRLNAKISAGTTVTDTHPEYKPHATVAYLKPGKARKYVSGTMGHSGLEGREFIADRVSFMPKDGEPTSIPLATTPAETTPSKGSPAAPARQPYDGERAQKAYSGFKGQLSRVLTSRDPERILAEVRRFNAHYLETGEPLPDTWARWQTAADDAVGELRRKGQRPAYMEIGRPNPPAEKKPVTPQIVPGRKPAEPAPVPLGGEVETFTPKDPEQLARFVRAAGGLTADREGGGAYDLSLIPLRFRNNGGITVAHMAERIAEEWGQPYEEGDLLRDLTRLETTKRQQQETRTDAAPEPDVPEESSGIVTASLADIQAALGPGAIGEHRALALDIMAAVKETIEASGDLETALDVASLIAPDAMIGTPGGKKIPQPLFTSLLESLKAPQAGPLSEDGAKALKDLRDLLGSDEPPALHEEAPAYGPADFKKIGLLVRYGGERYAQGLKDFDRWAARMRADVGPAVEPFLRPAFDRIVEKAAAAAPPATTFKVGDKVIMFDEPDDVGTITEILPGGKQAKIDWMSVGVATDAVSALRPAPAPGSTIEPAPQEAANGTLSRPAGAPDQGPLEGQPAADVPRAGGEARPEGVPAGGGGADEGPDVRPGGAAQAPQGPGVGAGEGGVGAAPVGGRRPTTRVDTRKPAESRPAGPPDYRITEPDQIGVGGPVAKARGNLEAIRLLKKIEGEARAATKAEQDTLTKYVGWGQIPQVFDDYPRHEYRALAVDLKALLTPDEWRLAAGSTPNAHYTAPAVVDAMWKAVQRLGLKPGARILEPAVGAGYFFGLMPPALAPDTRRVGVELDSITGRIAKLLYPQAQIHVAGFEDVKLPHSFFDLAISNVPFGNYPVHDPDYRTPPFLTRSIHDYFFAKAIDKVRPGGVVAFVTSSFTMDKLDSSMRKYLAERADLLGAIRLPNTAFKANAGTEVTTDIIFLQRRASGTAPAGQKWQSLTPITGKNKEPMQVNEYYAKHPEMMLGDMAMEGTQYATKSAALVGPPPTPEALANAVKRLPANALKAWEAPEPPKPVTVEAPSGTKDGAFVMQDGKLMIRRGSVLEQIPGTGVRVARIKGQMRVRDALLDLMRGELENAQDLTIAAAREKLNHVYDAFVRQHGYLSTRANYYAFSDDPDAPRLLALEDYDPDTEVANKAAIFRERQLRPPGTVEHVESAADALVESLRDKARLDWPLMERLTGKSAIELQTELGDLVYRNPAGDLWETRDEYLSGNVRAKLVDAESAAKVEPAYQRNVDALKAVQPIDLEPHEISARIGAPWVEERDVADFMGHLLGVRPDTFLVHYVEANATWYTRFRNEQHLARAGAMNTQEWGTPDYWAEDLIADGLNQRTPTVYKPHPTDKDKRIVDIPKTTLARAQLQKIKEEWDRWLWSDDPRATRLAKKYNWEKNNLKQREFDGGHQKFPGMARLSLRNQDLDKHQKDAVWRIVQTGNTGLAHVVGAGKTFEIAAAAMELRRLALSRKNMIVVPNHLAEQWGAEFLRLYPTAKILVAGKAALSKTKRQRTMAKIATGDYDAVIVRHSSFYRIAVSPEEFNRFLNEQIDALEDAIKAETAASGKRAKSVKDLEKAKKRLTAKLRKRDDRDRKDRGLYFEELGIDSLFVDEAHEYKNLYMPTKMTRVAGLSNRESHRAFDMFVKTQYISRRNGGQRGVVFATGTPISNTIAEMLVMQMYLQRKYLQDAGFGQFDGWATTFGQMVTALEFDVAGGFRMHSRFAQFSNLPELVAMFRRVWDVQTASMLNLPRPALAGGKPEPKPVEATPELKAYIKELQTRADHVRGIREDETGKKIQDVSVRPDPTVDNMLKITGDGAKAALDMRLVHPGAVDNPNSKLNQAVGGIFEIWDATREPRLTQIVFMDLGTPKPEQGEAAPLIDLYADVKAKLVRRGVPEAEVAFIHDADTDEQKLALFKAVNAGKVRIILGSTPKMGVGTNIQKRALALHHLDVPWKPSEIEQREGRIWRQGNDNPEIRILRWATIGSFDAYRWQTIETKARFIEQVLRGELTTREANDISGTALSSEEMKAIISGNPIAMEKVRVDSELRVLDTVRAQHYRNLGLIERYLRELPDMKARHEREAARLAADLKTYGAAKAASTEFAVTIRGDVFTGKDSRGPAATKLLEEFQAARRQLRGAINAEGISLGSYMGFEIRAANPMGMGASNPDWWPWLRLVGEDAHNVTMDPARPESFFQSADGVLRYLDASEAEARGRIANDEKNQTEYTAQLGKPFADEAKWRALQERKKQIDTALATDKDDDQASDLRGDDEGGPDAPAPEDDDDDDTPNTLREDTAPYRPSGEGAPAPTFFSALRDTIDKKMPAAAVVPHIKAIVRGPGVKADEVKWVGLEPWLDAQAGKVTKAEVLRFLDENEVQVVDDLRDDREASSQTKNEFIANFTPMETVHLADLAPAIIDGLLEAGIIDAVAAAGGGMNRLVLRSVHREYGYAIIGTTHGYILVDSANNSPIEDPAATHHLEDAHEAAWENFAAGYADDHESGSIPGRTQYNRPELVLPGGREYFELLLKLKRRTDPSADYSRRFKEVSDKYGGIQGDELTRRWSPEESAELQAMAREADKSRQGRYTPRHFDDAADTVVHIRAQAHIDADGKLVLVLNEIQSDWHQKGRDEGYRSETRPTDWRVQPATTRGGGHDIPVWSVYDEQGKLQGSVLRHEPGQPDVEPEEAVTRVWRTSQERRVPPAPFSKTYHELAMKRMIRWAAEHGFDRLAWTTGDQQNARYNLASRLKSINYEPPGPNREVYILTAMTHNGRVVELPPTEPGKLAEVVGQEVAAKILAGVGDAPGRVVQLKSGFLPGRPWQAVLRGHVVGNLASREEAEQALLTFSRERVLTGLDLEVGGEGMRGFYDKMLPAFVNKYVKGWGAQVGTTKINAGNAGALMHDGAGGLVAGPLWAVERNPDGEGYALYNSATQGHEEAWSEESWPTREEAQAEAARRNRTPEGSKWLTVHSVDITPAMKASVLEKGQALFERPAPYGWDKVGPSPPTTPLRYSRQRGDAQREREAREAALRALAEIPTVSNPGRALAPRGTVVARTLGHGFSPEHINAELLRAGTVNLRGQVVRTAQDLATIGQVVRDPRFETVRYFYTKDGVIVGQEAITAGMPNSVSVFEKGKDAEEYARIRGVIASLGADAMWMLHNHPSGSARPSAADEYMTGAFVEAIPELRGHVIIDSNEYGLIERGQERGRVLPLGTGPEDPLLVPSLPHALLRRPLIGPQEVARLGAELKLPTGFGVLLYQGGDANVRGVQEVALADVMNVEAFRPWLEGQKRAFGSEQVFLYTPGPEDALEVPTRELMDSRHLTDYVNGTGRSLMDRHGARSIFDRRIVPIIRVEEPRALAMRSTFVPRAEADRIAESLRAAGHEDVEVRPIGPLASVWSRGPAAAGEPRRVETEPTPAAGGAGAPPPVTPPPAPPADAEPPLPPRPTPIQAARIRDDVRSLLAPATAGPAAGQQALIMREKLADFALKQERARQTLKAAQKAFDAMPGDERERFLRIADAIEEGTILELPDSVRPIAEIIRELTDQRSMQLRDRELVRHFIENYFGHIWKDPSGTLSGGADIGARFIGRRPLAGPESFRKHRTIPTYREGVELGLEPVSWNPVTIALLKLREMDKSIMGRDIFTEMKDQGLAMFVRFGQQAPAGWVKIDDKIARVLQYSEEEKGFVLRGDYYAPAEAARVLHNYLTPGLAGNAIFDAMRGVGNLLNQAQLGFSLFHLGFVTMDVQTSAAALAFQQLASGQPIRATRNLLLGTIPLAAPIAAFAEGSKVQRAALQAPGTVGGQMGEILEALVRSGGRLRMEARNVHGEQIYKNDSIQAWLQALRQIRRGEAGWKDWGRTVFGAFPAALEAAAWPTMEVMVPRMKLGVFARLALHELSKLGEGGRMQDVPSDALARAWDAVDDRLGQLVYDNLFWSRTLKDTLMLSTRAVGWNLGTARTVGGPAVGRVVGATLGGLLGGPPGAFYGAGAGYAAGALAVEAPGQYRRWRAGQGFELTPKLSYAMALVGVTALFGAMYQFLMTGEGPQEPQDYFYPRTGADRPDGNPDRVTLPGYMKDVNGFSHHPWTTVKHKLHPLIATVSQLLENEDFYGRAITDPEDPLTEKAIDLGDYLLRQFESFSFRSARQQAELGDELWRRAQGFVGITPAPAWTTRDEETQASKERSAFRRQLDKKTKNDRANPGTLRGLLLEEE